MSDPSLTGSDSDRKGMQLVLVADNIDQHTRLRLRPEISARYAGEICLQGDLGGERSVGRSASTGNDRSVAA